MSNYIFEIEDLTCEYEKGKPVLRIDDLKLPKGKLVFIMGVSGIGKSTFIETLGLMNNTIGDTGSISFHSRKQERNIENTFSLKSMWNKDNSTLASFRNTYFSFIFQTTNLMPNMSAGENMILTQLIEGKTEEEAAEEVKNVMKEVDLQEELFNRPITKLSGGQKQRLAFVRAITSPFEVLFGDEPTGNLDKYTSFRLMKFLKRKLQEKSKTGILVSHDIELAYQFADMIVLITPKYRTEHGIKKIDYGYLSKEHVLYKNNEVWTNDEGNILDAKAIIENTFKKTEIQNLN